MFVAPVSPSDADEDVAKLYGRLADLLGRDSLPESFHAYGRVPPFLKDLFMNLKKFVIGDGALGEPLRAKLALAVAVHAKNADWVDLLTERAEAHGIDAQTRADVVAVAATNYMYNTFFKFRTLSGTDRFDNLSVGLRAHTFQGTSLPDDEVELINIVISDLNACAPCVSGHVEKAKQLGLKDEQMLEAIQLAGVVYAGAMFLNAAKMG